MLPLPLLTRLFASMLASHKPGQFPGAWRVSGFQQPETTTHFLQWKCRQTEKSQQMP